MTKILYIPSGMFIGFYKNYYNLTTESSQTIIIEESIFSIQEAIQTIINATNTIWAERFNGVLPILIEEVEIIYD